ncbi:serine protease [Streptomyces sp. SID4985]|uniref:SSI family serine proteinase inhibitor n=1 Tax=Streptomyces sp. SID4985 TaxID=2690292 RepID=UPI00136C1614|nr:SSI family serine proteinase inhibitor [Streptomyces sp. SID4985]MYQ44506.1 serine protease [Streptomyces sp. SID4985]
MNPLTRATAAAAGALVAALGLLTATPASAASSPAFPGGWLHLTVSQGETLAPGSRSALLLCDPPRGTAHAREACAQLTAAGGDINRIPPKDVFCTMLYAPVTAHASGIWHGHRVEYTHTFSNGCVMSAQTGAVFALDA